MVLAEICLAAKNSLRHIVFRDHFVNPRILDPEFLPNLGAGIELVYRFLFIGFPLCVWRAIEHFVYTITLNKCQARTKFGSYQITAINKFIYALPGHTQHLRCFCDCQIIFLLDSRYF